MGHFIGPPAEVGIVSSGIFGVSPPAPGWTARTPYMFEIGEAIAAGGGTIVIQNNVATPVYSTNGGVTWTSSSTVVPLGAANPTAMAYETGVFSLTGNDGVSGSNITVWNSTDGAHTWVKGQTLNTDTNPVACMISKGQHNLNLMFAGLHNAEAGGNYFTSTNHGITWTQHNNLTNRSWGNARTNLTIIWDGAEFAALVRNTVTLHCEIVLSSTGIGWTAVADLGAQFNGSLAFCPVTVNNPTIAYLVSNESNTLVLIASSAAGLATATPLDLSAFGLMFGINCVFCDNLRFFAFDIAGNVVSSVDGGVTWVNEDPLNFASGDFGENAAYDTVTQTPVVIAGINSFTGSGTGVSCSTRLGP